MDDAHSRPSFVIAIRTMRGEMMNATLFQQLMKSTVSPYEELIAYEYLYAQPGMTLKKITRLTVGMGRTPSQAMDEESGLLDARESDSYRAIVKYIDTKIGYFDLAINGTPSWPKSLVDSERPAPVLYTRGSMSLMEKRNIAVVGARKATETGLKKAEEAARDIVKEGVSVTTGLAVGIDSAATKAALKYGASQAIGVMGTPIDQCYPKDNLVLLNTLLDEGGLVVSQVPFYRYHIQPFKSKKYYFPERNELMAAISDATFIIEASDTSGTLSQARACAHQGRPLFISKLCYDNSLLEWPKKWAARENVFIVEDALEALQIMNDRSFWRDQYD